MLKKMMNILTMVGTLVVGLTASTGFCEDLEIKLAPEKKVLSNGLTVIVAPVRYSRAKLPLISYQTWYQVGSVDEYPGITGVTHMFEHLMFKGTQKHPPSEFFQKLEAAGAEINAYTTRDFSVFFESFPSEYLEQVIELESDRMANLKLDANSLNAEKIIVIEEARLRGEGNPEARLQEALWQLAYRRHPYQWPVLGYQGDILGMSLESLQRHFANYYQPQNATVVVTGDVDPDTVFKQIRKYYDPIPSRPRPTHEIPEEPPQSEERRLVLRADSVSEKFIHGYHIGDAKDVDSHALDVLASILFDGSASRAYKKLVDEQGLLLEVHGTAFTPRYPGLFMISGIVNSKRTADQAERELDHLIRQVQDDGVTEEEVSRAVKLLTLQVMDGVRSPHGLAQLLGTVQLILGDAKKFREDLGKYVNVTRADVVRVANRYLNPNNRSVVIMTSQPKPESPKPAPIPSARPRKHKKAGRRT